MNDSVDELHAEGPLRRLAGAAYDALVLKVLALRQDGDKALAAAMVAAAGIAATARAADDEAIRKDRFTAIALHGLPCGEVVSVATHADNDHLATCRHGNRYRVFLNAVGRVIVQKQ